MATTLLDALAAWRTADDPWAPNAATALVDATALLRYRLSVLAERRDRDAVRVLADLTAAATDPNAVRLAVAGAYLRLTADRDGIAPTDTTAWCPQCHTRRVVEDEDPHASTYVGNLEVEWTQTALACGHTLAGPERVIGRSPGGEAAQEAMADRATQQRLARTAAAQDLSW